ncbi:hypothetical protein EV659_11246 [Rhodothalassium salexigens DSM 2132]|uniref:GyrI-like small molecule binding protein n=1 Tax=Rhodothalassium salexigens DSM 2132 TaxID=1188247 RepID=A0A4R2P8F4_RHOSA|nr:hypothetical protein [Rhodothalassium salexigens]MBB4212572.1 hypothetical protein [Rhodothalassium salexigens DSM 2132]TCP31117.1 hypothetical protein EV659_11246 [Rhodothalassium salexigens DSM 2132]
MKLLLLANCWCALAALWGLAGEIEPAAARAPMADDPAAPDSGALSSRDARVLRVEETVDPPQRFIYARFHLPSLADSYTIELRETRRLERLLGHHGRDRFGPVAYHVDFAQDETGALRLDVAAAIHSKDALAADDLPPGYAIKTSTPYRSLTLVFKGSPVDASVFWGRLEQMAVARGLTLSGRNREVLVDHDGFVATDYVTKLQLGVRHDRRS